jgi:hypothetical protein
MSARDAESGSSTYKGGSGRAGGLGNGGLGGGMGAGMGGGGAARNGGYGNRTGLTTGNTMFGGMAFGRPGGFALNSSAWGVRPQPKVTQGALNSGLLGTPTPASVPGVNPAFENVLAVEDVPPYTPNVFNQNYLGGLANFRGMINNRYGWNDQPVSPWSGQPPRAVSPINALDNDVSTLLDRTNQKPRNIGGMGGGMGIPGYASPGTVGFGGAYVNHGYNPGSRGPGQRGW